MDPSEQEKWEAWDPRNDQKFWRNVAIAAGVPPTVVLGILFPAGVGVPALLLCIVKIASRVFKSENQVAAEEADRWARAALRREILRGKMSDPDTQVTMWMRVVRAYYELTAPNDVPPDPKE